MSKINQKEYEKLKSLGSRWKWIARDKNRCLYVFTGKPVKKYGPLLYWGTDGFLSFELFDEKHLFQFIQWENSEPYNIDELIEEYEEYLRTPVVPKFSINGVEHLFENESEKKELKDNKLNGKTLNKILTEYFDETALSDDDAKIILDYHKFDDETLIELALGVVGLAWGTSGRKVVDILDDFDQLDELEVLSHKWIDENQHPYGGDYHVPSEKLEDVLVPKKKEPTQEQVQKYLSEHGIEVVEKLVIPQFVAGVIEAYKSNSSLTNLLADLAFHGGLADFVDHEDKDKAFEWAQNNQIATDEILAHVWIHGYGLEEEQKYRVIFPSVGEDGKGFNYLAKDCYHKELWVEDTRTDGLVREERSSFTEDEIRNLDKGDILFEHFSVNVKELEE